MRPDQRTATSLLRALVLALVAIPSIAAPVGAQEMPDLVQMQEWDVPWPDTRPRDPYLAPDGNVWFVGQRGDYAAMLDPETGEFRRIDMPEGAGPHNLVVDDEGIVWYAGNRAANIGRIDPETEEITLFPMPDPAARDPHTLEFDGQGGIAFTAQNGNFVGHFDLETKEVRLTEAPQVPGRNDRMTGVRPYGIKMDSKGDAWIALFGSHMLGKLDLETMELTTYESPRPDARLRRLVVDSQDRVWYVDYAGGKLGRFDPATEEFTEWDNPSGEGARPYGVAIDADDRIWFVETGVQPNRFVGFDARTEKYISTTDVPSGGGTIRHMYYDRNENVVWFGADTNTIGRATLPPLRRVVMQQR
jgi:virginiamycin B lyase